MHGFIIQQLKFEKKMPSVTYSCNGQSHLFFLSVLQSLTREEPTTEATKRLKVPLGPEFWYFMYLHFRTQFVLLSHHTKFQLITTTRSHLFRTVFVEILRPPLLALVPEAGLRMSGSDVRGSPQTQCLHMITCHGKLNCPRGNISCQLFVA